MGDTRLVIHGHFYQPPRENPWTEEVAREASAAPFHDWNERITAEAYRPNGWARVVDEHGRVTDIVDNFEHLSFNVGPTRGRADHDGRQRPLALAVGRPLRVAPAAGARGTGGGGGGWGGARRSAGGAVPRRDMGARPRRRRSPGPLRPPLAAVGIAP